MKAVVTKESSDYWYRIKVFNTLEDILKFIERMPYRVIVETNPFTKDDTFRGWENMNATDIPIIKNCTLHIYILDENY